MTVKTRAQLKAENAADFPNNQKRLISPADLRGQLDDIVDSMIMAEDPLPSGTPGHSRGPQTVSPYDKGAVLDGTTDDWAAAQEAVEECITTGKTFVFNGAPMLLSQPLKFGESIRTSYEYLIDRGVAADDTLDNAATDSEAAGRNNTNFISCNIAAESNAIVVAGFTPSVYTPVIEHNLSSLDWQCDFRGPLTIITPDFLAPGGRLNAYGVSAVPDNKLIGLAVQSRGLRSVHGLGCYGMGATGALFNRAYWTDISEFKAMWCGDAFHAPGGNAMDMRHFELWLCNRGVVFDGGVSFIRSIHSEHVAGPTLRIFVAGSCIIDSMYIEDTQPGDGTGLYAIELGETADAANKVLFCHLSGIFMGSITRPGKKFMRLWGTNQCMISASSIQGAEVDADATSTMVWLTSGDIPTGVNPSRNISMSTAFAGPIRSQDKTSFWRDVYELSHAFGTVAAGTGTNNTFTIANIPTTPSFNYAIVDITHDGSAALNVRGKLINPTSLLVEVVNNSPSNIVVGTLAMSVRVDLWSN